MDKKDYTVISILFLAENIVKRENITNFYGFPRKISFSWKNCCGFKKTTN